MLNNISLSAQAQQRLLDAVPQLLDALVSLAQGTATTVHERRVASATQRTRERSYKGDEYERFLFPWREEEEMVLIARDTYSHKPDSKALLYLLDLLQSPLQAPTEQPTAPEPEANEAQPTPQNQLTPTNDTASEEVAGSQPKSPPTSSFWLGPPPRTFWKQEHNTPDTQPSFPFPRPIRPTSPLQTIKNSSFQEDNTS